MDKFKVKRRKRRTLSEEFRAEAVRLCRVGDRGISQVAKDLDIVETSLRNWMRRADIDDGKGPPGALASDEREELARLRRENRRLREDQAILKKAAAFFAREST